MSELQQEQMNIVIVGHVDHGKSTVIGRLLADTDALPEGKLAQLKAQCERNAKVFEYAFLLDALKDEQAQGITIDSARVFFKTGKRHYIIIDAPGHIEFLKNMVSGASRAEAALLVIDAQEGIQENSCRHGYLLAMLGIRQMVILVNKLDLLDYSQTAYEKIKGDYQAFLERIGVEAHAFIPISGFQGANLAQRSENMPWYTGPTVLEVLDQFSKEEIPAHLPFRLPVQDVYKFTGMGDDRRIVAGQPESGSAQIGQSVIFYPSGKRSQIQSIENTSQTIVAGQATGFTLKEQIYITRGEIACLEGESRPELSSRIRVSLFWLGRGPLEIKKEYIFRLGTARVNARLEKVERRIQAANLTPFDEGGEKVERHEVADCILKLEKAIAFEVAENHPTLSRFVLVDDYQISGGGIIQASLPDEQTWIRDRVILRNYKWERSYVDPFRRARRYNQRATLLLVTGPESEDKKKIAKSLEQELFNQGQFVYFLGIGNVIYGVDADIKQAEKSAQEYQREEHLRRFAEVAHILLDSGLILIVTAVDLVQVDLELIRSLVQRDRIETVWVGDAPTTELVYDLLVPADPKIAVSKITARLEDKQIIYKAW